MSEDWRDRSYAVPVGGVLGTGATDFFCSAVGTGSMGLVRLLRSPLVTLGALAVLLGILLFALSRTTWRPVAPLRLARRRSWGQVLSASARMYVHRIRLFLGIGLLLFPVVVVTTLLQSLVIGGARLLGVEPEGEAGGALVLLVVGVGTTLTVFGLALVQAATACALVEIDEGRTIGPVEAYRLALRRARPLLGAVAIAVAIWFVLSSTIVLLPVAIWLAVRFALLAQVTELEDTSAVGALRRSSRLVRRHWLKIASLVGVGAAVVIAAGPFLGALLILLTSFPLAFLNLVAGVVYVLAMPFVALATCYLYFDTRTRLELDPTDESDELPAEIQLST